MFFSFFLFLPHSCITVQNIDGCAGLAIKQMMKCETANISGGRERKSKKQNKNGAHLIMLLHISKNQIESVVVQIVWKIFEANEKSKENDRINAEGYVCSVHAVRIVYH